MSYTRYNGADYASLPSGFRLKLDELDQHEYWGADFAAGNCEWLLIKRDKGSGYIALITFGKFTDEEAATGYVGMFHTQTGARTTGEVIGRITKDTDVSKFSITKKVATWTCK